MRPERRNLERDREVRRGAAENSEQGQTSVGQSPCFLIDEKNDGQSQYTTGLKPCGRSRSNSTSELKR